MAHKAICGPAAHCETRPADRTRRKVSKLEAIRHGSLRHVCKKPSRSLVVRRQTEISHPPDATDLSPSHPISKYSLTAFFLLLPYSLIDSVITKVARVHKYIGESSRTRRFLQYALYALRARRGKTPNSGKNTFSYCKRVRATENLSRKYSSAEQWILTMYYTSGAKHLKLQ